MLIHHNGTTAATKAKAKEELEKAKGALARVQEERKKIKRRIEGANKVHIIYVCVCVRILNPLSYCLSFMYVYTHLYRSARRWRRSSLHSSGRARRWSPSYRR